MCSTHNTQICRCILHRNQARKLPAGRHLAETLELWASRLMGFDNQPEFVRATKLRLLLLATLRSPQTHGFRLENLAQLFPMVCEHDFLQSPDRLSSASHILINPPYNDAIAPLKCPWASGKVSAAALFMDACLAHAARGAKIAAILPDVLRAGSYYQRWRQHVEFMADLTEIATCGQFDKWTDVHVFILRLLKTGCKATRKTRWWTTTREARQGNVGDYFKVHVGPVVPHRHAEKGPSVAYVHAKTLPPWGRLERMSERRKFSGTLFEPPFVAVRRTSRPGDKRAIGTIVTGKRRVAAENHVLVLLPNNKTITQCTKLLRILRNPQTDIWLNKRIRCRHLTVGAVEGLPWWRPAK